jgi:hypothetical protein
MTNAGIHFFAVPNSKMARFSPSGSFRGNTGSRKTGVSKGAPGIIVTTKAKNGNPTAIEMKCADGDDGDLRQEQVEWRDRLIADGWNHVVGFGCDDAIAKLSLLGYPVHGDPVDESLMSKRREIHELGMKNGTVRLLFSIGDAGPGWHEAPMPNGYGAGIALESRGLAKLDFEKRPRKIKLTDRGLHIYKILRDSKEQNL